jgi:hypothetical protein
MMHKIAQQLPECNCSFTPYYADGYIGWLGRKGALDFTILGGRHRRNTDAYLVDHGLQVDLEGKKGNYDLVITCTDAVIPSNVRGKRLVLVQEGMTEPEGALFYLVRYLGLPRYLANTAATGLSDAYDLFCVASPGYRDLFIRKGVRPEKIAVTGIPNFDNVDAYRANDFPHRGYVLVATSDAREVGKRDDRPRFLQEAQRIASGRQIIFKLHPNENATRAMREIETYAPGSLVLATGDINPMVANCDVLITQYSSVVFIGLALGKEVHSYRNVDELRALTPIQNGGRSAQLIAARCQRLLQTERSLRPDSERRYPRRQGREDLGAGTVPE